MAMPQNTTLKNTITEIEARAIVRAAYQMLNAAPEFREQFRSISSEGANILDHIQRYDPLILRPEFNQPKPSARTIFTPVLPKPTKSIWQGIFGKASGPAANQNLLTAQEPDVGPAIDLLNDANLAFSRETLFAHYTLDYTKNANWLEMDAHVVKLAEILIERAGWIFTEKEIEGLSLASPEFGRAHREYNSQVANEQYQSSFSFPETFAQPA